MPFKILGLQPAVLKAVADLGFEKPTPIQEQAIPKILEGCDLIGSAQTGTGKTGAFSLPILSQLGSHQPGNPRALILEPTRELAAQVDTATREFATHSDLRIDVVYGGVGYGRQIEALKKGVDVLVATPGRLIDHMNQGRISLKDIQHVVLDEADRMLDMGFLPDVRRILEKCPRKRQTLLFSATIPPEIETLIKWAMRDPQTIEIGHRRSPAETVKHVLYPVSFSQKAALLVSLLDQLHWESVILFCRTKQGADLVGSLLKKHNHSVAVLHSDRNQKDREKALKGFRSGDYEVLVATDIASRGLDIQDVTHVINYDVPEHPEDYVHRIGRTGRAQAKGDALTLMVAEDAMHVQAIERFIGAPIPREKLEGFEYKYTALFEEGKPNALKPHERKFKAVRISGGYSFSLGGRGKKKRRKR